MAGDGKSEANPALGLRGKRAVVTGAGSGIGRAIAIRLTHEGAHVTILELSKEDGMKTVEALQEAAGGKDAAAFIQCDVSDTESVRQGI